jgi:hypothetical protein
MKKLAEMGHECYFYDSHPPYEDAEKKNKPYSPMKGITVLPPNYPIEDIGEFALYYSNPTHYNWVEEYKPEYVIFDNLDLPIENQTSQQLKLSCRRADMILNVSDYLMDLASGYSRSDDVLYVPNGVEFDFYKNNKDKKIERIEKIKEDYDQIIGYTGVFWKETNDWDLFVKIAESMPENVLLCSGAFFKDYGELPENMIFVGHLEREDLPAMISSFDVAVIPFYENDFTKAMCPLKVFEYLACGRTILSTPIPEVEKLRNRNIAPREKFISRLKQLISKEPSERTIKMRINEAKKYDWEEVLKPMVRQLEEDL